MANEIGIEVKLDKGFDETVHVVIDALKSEGFGVLTQIDVRATLKEKLGEQFRPYIILGACNPPLAHRALSEDPVVGLMLPCNVTIEEVSASRTLVRLANPEVMMRIGELENNQILSEVASEARVRLERVAQELIDS